MLCTKGEPNSMRMYEKTCEHTNHKNRSNMEACEHVNITWTYKHASI